MHKDAQENKNAAACHKARERQLSGKLLLKLVEELARLSDSRNACQQRANKEGEHVRLRREILDRKIRGVLGAGGHRQVSNNQ